MEEKDRLKDKYISKDEYEQYIFSLKAYRDYKNSMDTARDEGKAEGLAEGKAEGLAEGEQERLKLQQRIAELERQIKKQTK